MNDEYNYIEVSNFWFIFWLVISILFTIFSLGMLFILLIIPLCYFFILKNCKYYYNNDKLIIEEGVFNKKQFIIPFYRITNIVAQDNIFNFGYIFIQDKGQTRKLKYVKNAKKEMMKLNEIWEKAKDSNVRNEVF